MKKTLLLTAAILSAAIVVIGYTTTDFKPEPSTTIFSGKPAGSMRAFRSEQELKDYFKELLERQQKLRREAQAKSKSMYGDTAACRRSACCR